MADDCHLKVVSSLYLSCGSDFNEIWCAAA